MCIRKFQHTFKEVTKHCDMACVCFLYCNKYNMYYSRSRGNHETNEIFILQKIHFLEKHSISFINIRYFLNKQKESISKSFIILFHILKENENDTLLLVRLGWRRGGYEFIQRSKWIIQSYRVRNQPPTWRSQIIRSHNRNFSMEYFDRSNQMVR